MSIAEKIQELRKSQGYSQEKLAELLGVSRQAISKWESGVAFPSIDKLAGLSKIFGVSVGELLAIETGKVMDETDVNGAVQLENVMDLFEKSQSQSQGNVGKKRRWNLIAAAAAGLFLIFLRLFCCLRECSFGSWKRGSAVWREESEVWKAL